MSSANKIAAKEFCTHHHIEIEFLHLLNDYGLVEITTAGDDCYLDEDQLAAIEKMIRLHYDLHINLEGIDAVQHLLHRMEIMQHEMNSLRNRLRLYETE